jgi:hypothetical protein
VYSSLASQGSGQVAETYIVSAPSGTVDNLPEPYQPPPSNATSEDVHVGIGVLAFEFVPGAGDHAGKCATLF